jgi:hypothetical protein
MVAPETNGGLKWTASHGMLPGVSGDERSGCSRSRATGPADGDPREPHEARAPIDAAPT